MDSFTAHQGVEDDDMNVICLGGKVIGHSLAMDLTWIFPGARFEKSSRFNRRLKKAAAELLEGKP